MELSYRGRGASSDPLLNHGLSGVEVVELSTGTYVYARNGGEGGVLAFRVEADGQTLTRTEERFFPCTFQTDLSQTFDVVSISGQPMLIVGGNSSTGLMAYALTAQGHLGDVQSIASLPNSISLAGSLAHVSTADGAFLYVSDPSAGDVYGVPLDETANEVHYDLGAQGFAHLSAINTSERSLVLALHRATNELFTLDVRPQDGALHEVDRLGPSNGLWISDPTALETVSAFGSQFVTVAAAGSNSISVAQVQSDGALIQTDHLIDNRETRFGSVQTLSVSEAGDHVFVVAGGGDDGLTMFKLLPTGRLVHLETIVHQVGHGLMNVTDLDTHIVDGTLHTFVTSQGDGGIAHFGSDLSNLGVVVTEATTQSGTSGDDVLLAPSEYAGELDGGAGDDILVARGHDLTMRGGNGADIFVLQDTDAQFVIEDFQVGVDVIDMSAFLFLRAPSQLDVTTTSTGAIVLFRDAIITVTSSDQTSLERQDIFGAEFHYADHLFSTPDLDLNGDSDQIIGTSANDTLTGTELNDTILGGEGDDDIAGADGDDTILGEIGEDTIRGGQGDDTIDGGTGHDRLYGDDGDDLIVAGPDNDVVEGGPGNDFVLADGGNDRLILGDGDDIAFGGSGRDIILGGAGRDTLDGGASQDELDGQAGDDELWGAGDRDVLFGGPGDDALSGGNDPDELYGQDGKDALVGGNGNDLLDGGLGDDVLFGNTGDDTLIGGAGHDRFWGGAGNDVLRGDGGRDLFVFGLDHGQDTILDFSPGADRIQILASDAASQNLSLTQTGQDARLAFGNTQVTLVGVDANAVQEADIMFGW